MSGYNAAMCSVRLARVPVSTVCAAVNATARSHFGALRHTRAAARAAPLRPRAVSQRWLSCMRPSQPCSHACGSTPAAAASGNAAPDPASGAPVQRFPSMSPVPTQHAVPPEEVAQVVDLIQSAQRLLVISGAGVSTGACQRWLVACSSCERVRPPLNTKLVAPHTRLGAPTLNAGVRFCA